MMARIEDGVIYSPHSESHVDERSANQLIKDSLTKFSDKIIAIDDYQRLTGGDLLIKICKYATGFQQHGVKPGSRVCAHISNALETVAATLGVAFLGATLVLAKTSLVPRELLSIIQEARCDYLLTDQPSDERLLEVNLERPMKGLFSVGSVPGFVDVRKYQELSSDGFQMYVPGNVNDEVLVVLSTSGSSGLPKGAEISHKSFVSSFHAFRASAYCTEEDVFLAWNPFTHLSGFGVSTFFMCLGATAIFKEPNISVKDFLDAFRTYKISLLLTNAVKMQEIVGEIDKDDETIPQIKTLLLGGTLLSKKLGKTLSQKFRLQTLAPLYGLTETFGFISGVPVGQIELDNCGVPAFGCSVKIEDVNTRTALGPYEHGEIVAKCQSVMKGYYNRPEETAAILSSDGWLRTGDIGYYDNDGRIYFVERLKEMIKCLGNQVAPAELESILLTNDAVKDVVVLGVPSLKYGEAPTAYVVLKDGYETKRETIEEDLKNLIAEQTAPYKHLYGGVYFMDSFTKSGYGKILRSELKAKLTGLSTDPRKKKWN